MYLAKIPKSYCCGQCGAKGKKLWRPYQGFQIELFCASCALKDQKKTGPVDDKGRIPTDPRHEEWTDQIGWLVPAVLTEDGKSYWAYSAVPDAGVAWWRALPT